MDQTFRAHIQITLKPSVLDPQGAAVERALAALGHSEVSDVRVGRYFVLTVTATDAAAARARVAAMCETLLANPVIERHEFTIEAPGEAGSKLPPRATLADNAVAARGEVSR